MTETELQGGKRRHRRRSPSRRRRSSPSRSARRVTRIRSSLRRLSRKLQRLSRDRSIAARRPAIRVLVVPRRSPVRAGPQRTAYYRSPTQAGQMFRSARGPVRQGEYQIGAKYYQERV